MCRYWAMAKLQFLAQSWRRNYMSQTLKTTGRTRFLARRRGADAAKQNLQRNVVGPASVERQLYQSEANLFRTRALDRKDQFFLCDLAPQPIGTENDDIAIFQHRCIG